MRWHCAILNEPKHKRQSLTEIIPYLFYRNVPDALAFLGRAFGFSEEMRVDTPSGGMHAQMLLGGQRIMMGQPAAAGYAGIDSPARAGTTTMGVFVYLDDVDAHHTAAAAAGAEITTPPYDESYGRTYTAKDLDGHLWFFATAPSK